MFFSKRVVNSDIFKDMLDAHSHILPGVDDGVRTSEESFAILDYYEQLGMKRVIFTPHIMEDVPQDIDDLKQRFESLKSDYSGGLELSLAAEYMLDYAFFALLEREDMLPLCDNYLLVEMSYAQPVVNIFECVDRIMAKGYFVVLAHPERYLYMSREEYAQLKDLGVKFQLNLTSLLGAYGTSVNKRAKWLLESSYYDLIGSDIHSLRHSSKVLNDGKLSSKHIKLIEAIKSKDLF